MPKRAVFITFDDGYVDNLYSAKPLLERHDIPATVFVTTGYVADKREFWWDELEGLFLLPGKLPETLRLSVNRSAHFWELGESADYSEDAYWRYRRWNVEEQDATTPVKASIVPSANCCVLCPMGSDERCWMSYGHGLAQSQGAVRRTAPFLPKKSFAWRKGD